MMIEQHFRDEERILYEVGFEGTEQHRRQHLAILNKAKEIVVDYEAGIITSGDLFQFLAGELVLRHMTKEDADFAPHFRRIYLRSSSESQPGTLRLAEKIRTARWRVPVLRTLWLSIVSALLAGAMLIPGHLLQRIAGMETEPLAGADGGWRERTGDPEFLSLWKFQLALSGGLFAFLVAGVTIFTATTERANRARARAEAGTDDAVRKLRTIMETSFEGIIITKQGNIVEANDQFLSMTGYERKEIIGKNVEFFLPPSERSAVMHNIIHEKESLTELTVIAKDGRILFLEAHGRTIAASGQMERITTLRDITALKNHQQQLDRAAHYDPLTVLPNRSHFVDHLRQALHQCSKRKQPLAVAYLDLDEFASLNEHYGRRLGDEMLTLLGQRIRKSLRNEDMIGRIGSDEFAVILSGVGKDGNPRPILERLLNTVSARATLAGQGIATSASIGVAFFPGDGTDPDQLLQHSNQAMYAAKEAGGNRYHIFDSDTGLNGNERRIWRTHIREALAKGEFELHYQPQVDMSNGRVFGAEGLIRWRHPERGLLPPGDFLPAVLDDPVGLELGEWVIERALAQLARWRTIGLDLHVSVNVTAEQIQQENFSSWLRDRLASHPDVPAERLGLEITETHALEDLERVSGTILSCRKLGVHFALDDFGTGYSSLSYLRRLPARTIKIDQSFVRGMLTNPEDQHIVVGVLGLARAFDRDVIAEGVETENHGRRLLAHGCTFAQGYGIARPMPPEDMASWIDAWRPFSSWETAAEGASVRNPV